MAKGPIQGQLEEDLILEVGSQLLKQPSNEPDFFSYLYPQRHFWACTQFRTAFLILA